MAILLRACCLAAVCSPVAAGLLHADEPAPNIAGETLKQVAARTGYTVEQLKDFFPPVSLNCDAAGLAKDRFAAPPPPGVHPRVFFNPEDLAGIRRRARETQAGKILVARLREQCEMALRADPEEARKLRFTSIRELYDELADGQLKGRPQDGLPASAAVGQNRSDARSVESASSTSSGPEQQVSPLDQEGRLLSNYILFEAFRSLLDEDAAAGKRCAAAFIGLLRLYNEADCRRIRDESDFQPIVQLVHFGNFGMTYDCLHPVMSAEQRVEARAFLAMMTRGKTSTGMRSLPAFPANTTNWIPYHASLLSNVLAIEGEEGFDPAVYQGMVETLRKWIALGVFPSGGTWESLGKNELGAEYLIPLAKRGEMLIASQQARNHVANFYLQVMQPYGHEWTWFTDHGGSHGSTKFIDVEVLKYAYPADPAVDFVYRNMTGEDYDYFNTLRWVSYNVGPMNGVAHVLRVVMAEDHHGGTWEDGLQAATDGKPLTFFDDGLGRLIARSAWASDAIQLLFQPRHVPDGHSQAERGTFTLSALGRNWVEKVANSGGSHAGSSAESRFQSVVLIDDVGQGVNHTPSGRSVALADTPEATLLAVDLSDAYNWKLGGPVTWDRTPNDHRLVDSELPWMSLPWRDLPHWLHGGRSEVVAPNEQYNRFGSVAEWNPVRRAFRTAGVVRGPHPYVLIVDDIQKDDAEHSYKWLMQLADDLELIESKQVDFTAGQRLEWYRENTSGFRADLILTGRDEIEDRDGRRLLVRVLENAPTKAPHAALTLPGYVEIYQKDIRGHRPFGIGKRLVVPSRSVAPNFKVLLFPHRAGEPLPVTTWADDRMRLNVEWPDQQDEVVFIPDDDGRTRMRISRNGRQILELK